MSSVNQVTSGAASYVNQTSAATQAAQTPNAQVKEEEKKQEVVQDEYAGSVEQIKTGNYGKDAYKVDMDKVNEMKASLKNNVGAFEKMVSDINKNNDIPGFGSMADSDWATWVQGVASGQIAVTKEQSDEAAALIAEDGYWGVEQTSDRIVEFAKTLSGGDPDKYDTMMESIEKGFGSAKEAWGREMPDITKQTYDKVMEKMATWKSELDGTATAPDTAMDA